MFNDYGFFDMVSEYVKMVEFELGIFFKVSFDDCIEIFFYVDGVWVYGNFG